MPDGREFREGAKFLTPGVPCLLFMFRYLRKQGNPVRAVRVHRTVSHSCQLIEKCNSSVTIHVV